MRGLRISPCVGADGVRPLPGGISLSQANRAQTLRSYQKIRDIRCARASLADLVNWKEFIM